MERRQRTSKRWRRQGDEAARRDIQQWDRIETVDGQPFTALAALRDWLKSHPATERIPVMLKRGAGITSRRASSEFYR